MEKSGTNFRELNLDLFKDIEQQYYNPADSMEVSLDTFSALSDNIGRYILSTNKSYRSYDMDKSLSRSIAMSSFAKTKAVYKDNAINIYFSMGKFQQICFVPLQDEIFIPSLVETYAVLSRLGLRSWGIESVFPKRTMGYGFGFMDKFSRIDRAMYLKCIHHLGMKLADSTKYRLQSNFWITPKFRVDHSASRTRPLYGDFKVQRISKHQYNSDCMLASTSNIISYIITAYRIIPVLLLYKDPLYILVTFVDQKYEKLDGLNLIDLKSNQIVPLTKYPVFYYEQELYKFDFHGINAYLNKPDTPELGIIMHRELDPGITAWCFLRDGVKSIPIKSYTDVYESKIFYINNVLDYTFNSRKEQ